jgi:cyclic pyranopterin phosphate synthase
VALYRFDGIGDDLDLVPLAARRALDCAGRHLSLDGWRSLPLALRRHLVALGSAQAVDADVVEEVIAIASPSAEPGEVIAEPTAECVPAAVSDLLGDDRIIPDSVWAGLAPLDRYALWKVASSRKMDRIAAAFAEIIGHSVVSPHVAPDGGARMVDVGQKSVTEREAVAESRVSMSGEAYERLRNHEIPKGDVLGVARIAGILAAKKTPELIPLCHAIALTRVVVELELDDDERAVRIAATVDAQDRTGVEMEALVAASVAALTVYDMLKGIDRAMTIGPTRLVAKSGGRSGDYRR